jgi:hypothetical protein
MPRKATPPEERFWLHFKKTKGCWLWTGNTIKKYGVLKSRNKWVLAHRISWAVHNGPIPQGLCVLHKCDQPACVRPSHLFLGTRRDNVLDMNRKGRRRPHAKLTADDVRAIRREHAMGSQQIMLAMVYGVSTACISLVVNRINWGYIN